MAVLIPPSSIEAELQDNERVTWTGSPSLQAMLVQQAPMMLFSVAFSGIALFNFIKGDSEGNLENFKGSSIAGLCFVGLFVSVGLFMFGSALWRLCATGRTAYAVTNKRILIVTDLVRREVVSIYPDAINALECSNVGSRGSITFRREVMDTGEGNQVKKLKFIGIGDMKGAAAQIEILRDSRRSRE